MPEPEAVVAEMADAVMRGDVDTALELISPTAIDHSALPGAPAGHAGWIEKWMHIGAAADGLATTVDQRVSQGDTVATRYRIARADTGELVGFALDMIRVADGKVAEHWALPLP
jgi:predicted SnoaL-like aldol condensation-catalyzing enzyme